MNELRIKQSTISSLEVAEMLGIKHYELLKKLEGTVNADGTTKQVGIIPVLGNGNFPVTDYFIKDSYLTTQNKEMPCYQFTKLGCDFIANKFTGEKGIIFTAKYVKKFNEMENYIKKPSDDKAKLTEAKLINAKVRLSNQFLKLSKVDTLSKEYKNILVSKATEILTGEQLIALPESKQKTYSATELGEMFGISSNKIGRLTNKYNLKTAEYGEYYRDKSQHSSKEVDAFRYYDSVIPELEKILEVKSKKIS